MSKIKGVKLMICGSQNFEDRKFVYGLLNQLSLKIPVEAVFAGSFSGASQFAREWADENKVKFEILNIFDDVSYSFYDGKKLPKTIVKNASEFSNIQQKFLELGVQLIIPCPNKEGRLGATTSNIVSIAQEMGMRVMDGELAYQRILEHRTEESNVNKGHKVKLSGANQL